MSRELASHNDDIRRLLENGYAVAFDSNYLVVRDIPYLDAAKQLRKGAIVCKLTTRDNVHFEQEDHQIFFAGSVPCTVDGTPIPNFGGGPAQLALSAACKDVVVQRSFSNKPKDTGVFDDLFHKIESYVQQISGPAMHLYDVTPYTFRAFETEEVNPIFKVRDTLTSRAEITDLAAKFANDDVALIGLGGTGSFLLDFLVKTPIPKIRAFDPDLFYVHNAFRSPGAIQYEDFGKPKAEVYLRRHDNFRHGLTIHRKFVDESSGDDFVGVTFAFVCVDKGSSRKGIFDLLLSNAIPFIDVGMGLRRENGPLTGMLRVTYYSKEKGETIRQMALADEADDPNDIYRTNIQIGELNALNACLAITKFKQLRGFYAESETPFHFLFDIADLKTAGQQEVG
jgi:molybdopterin/thiamine biosynthesis adenylyltransferase